MKTITLFIYKGWLPFLKVDYTIIKTVVDQVKIEIKEEDVAALIELGSKIERNKKQLITT